MRVRPVADEAAGLEALRPNRKSRSVKIQHPHLGATPADKHIQRTIQGIAAHPLLHQGGQSGKGLSHVTRSPVQTDPDLPFREKHQPRTTCSVTPPPNSRRTSTRGPPIPRAPRSMNLPGLVCAGFGFSVTVTALESASLFWRSFDRHP